MTRVRIINQEIVMGDNLHYEAPPLDMSKCNSTVAGQHPHSRAIRETARRMIEVPFDEQRIEDMDKLDDDDLRSLIGAAHAVSRFIAKSTGDVDVAVEKGTAILDLGREVGRNALTRPE